MKLLHYSAKPFVLDIYQQYTDRARYDHKPSGLWVSVPGHDDWEQWCRGENFGLDRLTYVTEIKLSIIANPLVIDDLWKLDQFTNMYGSNNLQDIRGIDWQSVKAIYDGIIIAPYQWDRRYEFMWYYSWDCASGVIWNLNCIEETKPYEA